MTNVYKPENWGSTDYTSLAHSLTCVKCDKPHAMPCHYTGLRQQWYGKGMRIKCSDLMIADLCYKCHVEFDQMLIAHLNLIEDKTQRKTAYSEEFLHYILLTLHRRLELGYVLRFEETFTNQLPI